MSIENIRRIKLEAGIPKKKEYKPIAKKSAKKIKQEILAKGDDEALKIWFDDRVKELTGFCKHCGGKTCVDEGERAQNENEYHANSKDYLRFSIAHILPKKLFPSVATHPLNYIELCFWNSNCHGNYDNKILDLIEMNCFDEIITKFVQIYPFIAKDERRRIPHVLLNYIETET